MYERYKFSVGVVCGSIQCRHFILVTWLKRETGKYKVFVTHNQALVADMNLKPTAEMVTLNMHTVEHV